ncbi:hypothetical protein BC629DRAFT_1284213, partial [Irpex lacteus]
MSTTESSPQPETSVAAETDSVSNRWSDACSQCECGVCRRGALSPNPNDLRDSRSTVYHDFEVDGGSSSRDSFRVWNPNDQDISAGVGLTTTCGEGECAVALALQLHSAESCRSQNPHKSTAQPAHATVQVVPANQTTGWAAVEKALTDFDKQEVGAYKEDIDSLLVFAGLYSAVLTAFVIVSYPQLQEDTAAETLHVLRLIANQTASYMVLGGQFVNTTAVVPAHTSFSQPSTAAILTNALWFSSLVISLSSASFSILVKQWLRAYTAFATASPQGQLRVRQYRRTGLEAWKVFAIASTLPLLLQLALALFFIGLCFFTVDIHPAIGNTTLPLVCAWAFLFTTVTFAPIFSAHCPYKTP